MLKTNHPTIDFVTPQAESTVVVPDQPYYKVQIMASIDSVSLSIPEFQKIEYPVERVYTESSSMYKYKYYVGPFIDKKDAKDAQKHVHHNGFPDAFLVYFE